MSSPKPEEPQTHPPRSILHVDMDAFFAAVEELDNPSLKGKPVIIGGTPEGHGVVSTANYVARKFGVHSAMPAAQAVKLCPHGVFLRGRHGRYGEVSRKVMAIFHEVTPLVEPLSIDEAFLDVTGSIRLLGEPTEIARWLKNEIKTRTGGLTASVGIASNKFIAKVASDLDKPDGLVCVPPGEEKQFLAPLTVKRIWGVGPKSRETLNSLGIHRVKDLQERSEATLVARFGQEFGVHLYRLSRGLDKRDVVPTRKRKSISCETTLGEFIPGERSEDIERVLLSLCEELGHRIHQEGVWGQSISLKVRDQSFHTTTRSQSLETPIHLTQEIYRTARKVLRERIDLRGRKLRLLGVGLGHLITDGVVQMDLFEAERHQKEEKVQNSIETIRDRMGRFAIQRGNLLKKKSPPENSSPS